MDIMAIMGAAGLFMVGGVMLLLARQSQDGVLARNTLYGIRTKSTLASEAAMPLATSHVTSVPVKQ